MSDDSGFMNSVTSYNFSVMFQLCLMTIDAVICYSYLPRDSLLYVLAAVCKTINSSVLCQISWEVCYVLLYVNCSSYT